MPSHISYGGIETVAINLWKEFIKQGHKVDFVCHGNRIGSYEDELLESGSKVYHIPAKGKNLRGTIVGFQKILKETKYDVVHAHMNATCGIYLQIAKKNGVSVLVAHSHASSMKAFTSNPIKAMINNFEKRRTRKYANVKIACSSIAGKWLFNKDEFVVILNAVDTSKFYFSEEIRMRKRNELGILEKNLVFLHVGGFLEYKNHFFLIDVFNVIIKKNKDAKLILVGDGPLRRDIINKIEQYNLENNIILLGERKDVNEIMQASDVFLLPSFSEGNPVALAEAATSGMHCIISDEIAKDIVKYFEEGQIEFLGINKENLKLWAEKAVIPRNRIKYSKENPSRLSANLMAKQVMSIYKKILGE